MCAICDKARPFHAHHVVEKQRLRQNGIPKADRYDTRNALRLCEPPCHLNFEAGMLELPLRKLTDANIEYAFEILGAHAYDYLRGQYTGEDPRVDAALALAEPM